MKFKQLAHYLTQPRFWLIIGLVVADGLVFGGSNPENVSSVMLIVAFLLLSASLYCLMKGIVHLIGWYGIPIRHKRRLTVVLTCLVAGVLALQSIGELTGTDILVLVPLAIMAYLYALYVTKRQS